MSNVALIVIFNHNYHDNIQKLEQIYQDRFKNIWYAIPFYQGNLQNVIPVFDNSYYFQNFIATALDKIKHLNFTHYIFIADDLYLNPKINENNYQEYFGLQPDSAFISNFFRLDDPNETRPYRLYPPYWPGIEHALDFEQRKKGFEGNAFLPNYSDAEDGLKKNGITFNPSIKKRFLFPIKFTLGKNGIREMYYRLKISWSNIRFLFKKTRIKYPLVGGYSDLLILPNQKLDEFMMHSRCFATLDLFVEIALPSALLYNYDKISTEGHLKFKTITHWTKNGNETETAHRFSLNSLNENFPADSLYIHPVKLSKWKN